MAQETHVRVGGSWEQVTATYVNVSGAWRNVTEIYTKVAGVWEKVFGAFAISNSGDANAFDTTVTNTVTISINGGVSPYTVSWVRISGSTVPQISNASGTSVTWSTPSTGNYIATWRCTVTDAQSATDSVDVAVTFTDLN